MDLISLIIIIISALAALITIYNQIKPNNYNVKYIKLPKERIKSILGSWEGDIIDITDNDTIKSYSLNLNLNRIRGNNILGSATIINMNDNNNYSFDVHGGFYQYHFFKFEYINTNRAVVHFGISLGELSSNSKELSGKYIGFGTTRERIILGDIKITKNITN